MTDNINKKTAVALGTFDGLHTGHMAVINRTVIEKDNGLLPVILLFSGHPLSFLRGEAPTELLTESLKAEEIAKTGCDTYVVSFEEIRNMTPEEFITEVLIKKLNAGFVSCGFNYRFGKNGSGDTDTLVRLCEKYGIRSEVAHEVDFKGEPVSSTRIRGAISCGNIEDANAMLGRNFAYDFKVVHGDNRGGKILGFPTANQLFDNNYTVPKFGVYASRTTGNGKTYRSVTNIGIRPTIGTDICGSETYIMDFSDDIYGKNIKVELLGYIRPEKKFGSLDELKEQMKKDCGRASEWK